jgi:LysM repeat protein
MASLPRPSRPGIVLDGQLLGTLSPETKQALEDITVRSQDRLQEYLDAQRNAGKNPDPAEVTRLRQQTRSELQQVLSPPQLEEFLLRYSQNANNLRGEFSTLKYFNPSPNEFRDIFRATDGLDQQIQLLADSTDPNDVAQRKTLEDQRELAIKNALGQKRYDEYVQLHDPAYRDAIATAVDAGTPEAVNALYALNVAIAAEQARINTDTNLTADQKAIELKRVELEQLKAATEATGGDLPPEPTQAAQAPPRKVHVVRPGDTPALLSLLYGVPFSAIKAANPNANLGRLRPGDTIFLPPQAGQPFSGP